MTNSALRIALTTFAFTALVGCTPMAKKSAIRDTITKEPDAEFLKRVKNDPFPAAGQMPATTPLTAAEVPTTDPRFNTPVATRQRAGVLGQTNITAGTGGPVNPTSLARTAATANATDVATASDAAAIASDETPLPATPLAAPTGTAGRPLTASRNNIRPLNRPMYGAARRN